MREGGLGAAAGTLILLLALGCAGQLPRLTSEQIGRAAARRPGTTAGTLDAGRALYVAKCSGCHTLVLPRARPREAWPALLDKMQRIAKLKEEDKRAILDFLLAAGDDGR